MEQQATKNNCDKNLSAIDNWLRTFSLQFGYFGIFIISVIGASTVIIPIPYTITLFWLGANSNLDITLLSLSSGLGSAIGELLGYSIGFFAHKSVSKDRKKKFEGMLRILTRSQYLAPILIFVFALTPLPDDLLFIPLGILKYSIWKAIIPAIIGKTLMGYILVYGGRVYNEFILSTFGETSGQFSIITMILTSILLIVVLVLMWKVDWEKLFLKNKSK